MFDIISDIPIDYFTDFESFGFEAAMEFHCAQPGVIPVKVSFIDTIYLGIMPHGTQINPI